MVYSLAYALMIETLHIKNKSRNNLPTENMFLGRYYRCLFSISTATGVGMLRTVLDCVNRTVLDRCVNRYGARCGCGLR